MADLGRALVGALAPSQDSRIGTVATLSPLTVALDGDVVPAVSELSMWSLAVGEPVVVERNAARNSWRLTRSLQTRPQWATVSSVASPTAVVVDGAGGTWTVTLSGAAPAIGARVIILWGPDGGVIVSTQTTAAAPTAPPPEVQAPADADAPPAAVSRGVTRVSAVTTGTYRGGALRTDGNAAHRLYQGHWIGSGLGDNSAAWFYGARFPDAGTCTSASIWLGRVAESVGSNAAVVIHLWLHTAATRTAGPPTTTGTEHTAVTLARGEGAECPIPTAWGQALIDRTAYGISLVYSGTADYAALRGLTGPEATAQSGRITLTTAL